MKYHLGTNMKKYHRKGRLNRETSTCYRNFPQHLMFERPTKVITLFDNQIRALSARKKYKPNNKYPLSSLRLNYCMGANAYEMTELYSICEENEPNIYICRSHLSWPSQIFYVLF